MSKNWTIEEYRYALEVAHICWTNGVAIDFELIDEKIGRGTNAINMMLTRLEYANNGQWFDSDKKLPRSMVVNRVNYLRDIIVQCGFDVEFKPGENIKWKDIRWMKGPAHGNSKAERANKKTSAPRARAGFNIEKVVEDDWQAVLLARAALIKAKGEIGEHVYGKVNRLRYRRKKKPLSWGAFTRYLNGYLKGSRGYKNGGSSQFVKDVVVIVRELSS